MRRLLKIAAVLSVALVAYLSLWPVPLDPVAWEAPVDRGYVDPFSQNDQLKYIQAVDLGQYEGPEDATIGADGNIYVTVASGAVLRLRNRQVEKIAELGGRGLGIETDHDGTLVIANADSGLQRVTLAGEVTTLLAEIDGQVLIGANNLAIGASGLIYFSISSDKFSASEYSGSYSASIVDLLEHGGNGSVHSFDPRSGRVETLLTNLNYANGVALSRDEQYLLVAETGHYRVLKVWLAGSMAGQSEVLLDNLPGFPDNIKNGLNDRFWIGMPAPRNALLDKLSARPWLRQVIWRLPAALRPKAEPVSHVIAINGNGDVLMNLQDERSRYPAITGVLETPTALIMSSLFGSELPILLKSDL